MARGIVLQIQQSVAGMRMVAIASRRVDQAARAYREAGEHVITTVDSVEGLEAAIERGTCAVTDDPRLVCAAPSIDVVVEVTGSVDFAARVALDAITYRKHLVLMNAEVDSTVGPLLAAYAREAGLVMTNADGDQPGVIMNLYRFVVGIGVRPVLCGNIKGLQDPHRTPDTQAAFAQRWGQRPTMVTSFADGTKIAFEQSVVANATGMRVARRGMCGPTVRPGTPITDAASWYPHEHMLAGAGIVDYVVGASPSPGVFVLGMHGDARQQHYLNLYKLGEGPFYCFYTPYHLCHFELPNTIARAVDFHDAAVAPLGPPMVDVVATTKIGLVSGEVLDGIGGYHLYGQCENADVVYRDRLLPMGIAEGCRIIRDVGPDEVLSYDDVETPDGRVCDRLRREQDAHFMEPGASSPGSRLWD